MKILVLNCGSSTLKFQLIEILSSDQSERKLARGIVDRIGSRASYRFSADGAQIEATSAAVADHERVDRQRSARDAFVE